MKAHIALAAVATVAAMFANTAQASDVSWSVTVGSPRPEPRGVYAPPPVIYSPPPVVYAPVPLVYHAAPVYHVPPGHLKKWHKHRHRYAAYPGAVVVVVKGKGQRHQDDD